MQKDGSDEIDSLMLERKNALDSVRGEGFLAQTCSSCGKEMSVGKGDVLYVGRWYHAGCWTGVVAGMPVRIVRRDPATKKS